MAIDPISAGTELRSRRSSTRPLRRMRDRSDAEGWDLLEHLLIDVAPAPVLLRLEASDHRVVRRMKVLRRMPMDRLVAASHVAALEAQTKMYPGGTHRQTLFTALGPAW